MQNRTEPSYWAILPASVRYDKELAANEKILYAEITALSNKYGFCFATNKYFAELYGVKERAVQRWLTNLVDHGYLERVVKRDQETNRVLARYLQPLVGVLNDMTPHVLNDMTPHVLNDIYNNTSINNTSNNSSSKSECELPPEANPHKNGLSSPQEPEEMPVKRNWTY